MNKAISRVLTSAAFIALSAAAFCASPEILPAAVGNKWEYDTVKLVRALVTLEGSQLASMKDASSGISVYEFLSLDDKANPPVFRYTETTRMAGTSGDGEETDTNEINLTSDATTLKIVRTSSTSSHDDKPEEQTYDPPLLFFQKTAAVGKSWDVGVMRDGEIKSPTSARIVGKETVTVPAGTFKDCAKVVYSSDQFDGTVEIMQLAFTITSGRSRGVYWVADGVGIVKELEISTSTAESEGPQGKPIKMESSICTVSELKPGYIVKK